MELIARYILIAAVMLGLATFIILIITETVASYLKEKQTRKSLSDAWERWAKK
jgi:hypothetical protein